MKKNNPYITIILVIINVLIFIIMEFMGSTEEVYFLYDWGAMYVPSLVYDGEWYRVITHMFLHSGFYHLANNMFMLAVVGSSVEKILGKVKYVVLYFLGGIGATIVSAMPELLTQNYSVGVGASGAITALVGTYIIIMIKERNTESKQYAIRLFIVLAIMVFGNMEEGVDWMAHLGGAISGLLLGMILYRKKGRKYE